MTLLVAQAALLQLTLRPGFVVAYDVVRDYQNREFNERTTIEERVTYRVTSPSSLGRANVEVTFETKKITVDGQATDLSGNKEKTVKSEERATNGQVFSRPQWGMTPALSARQTRPFDIKMPPEAPTVGLSWQYMVPVQDETGLPAAQWDWTLERLAPDRATIHFEFKELDLARSISATGTVVLDRKDGWPLELQGTIPETIVPGDSESVPVVMRVTWKRVP